MTVQCKAATIYQNIPVKTQRDLSPLARLPLSTHYAISPYHNWPLSLCPGAVVYIPGIQAMAAGNLSGNKLNIFF